MPDIHLFSARYKEHLGDVNGACASLQQCDAKTDSIFFEKVVTEANIERRLVCFLHCCIYSCILIKDLC